VGGSSRPLHVEPRGPAQSALDALAHKVPWTLWQSVAAIQDSELQRREVVGAGRARGSSKYMAHTPATMHSFEWDQIFDAATEHSYWRLDRAKVALRAPHLAGLAMSDVEACTAGSCILPNSP
jgi:hypothetical protein